jgi:TP901 family phage tail tape measure protein
MEFANSIVVYLKADNSDLQKRLNESAQILQQHGKKIQDIGEKMSQQISAPIAVFGALTLRTAGNFEAAMNTVQALSGATAKEMEVLTAKAKELGRTTQFSATEAAQGIETLLKNGLNTQQVMNGALDATLGLAAATKTSLANAADIATDAMLQFNLQATDLNKVVDQIAGVTIASKFGIDDVRLALANAGGVAGQVGVEFQDFAVAIAATSSAFSSGADAGTSLKTFLTALNAKSTPAKEAMQELGLSFFNAKGELDSMAVIAQKLQTAFSGLSEQQKLQAAETIFGTDAMRTALLLANQGAEGFNRLAQSINKVSAADMAAIQMRGFSGALKKLESSFEAFQIALANSGMLEFFGKLINALAGVFQGMSGLRPEILSAISVFAGLVAAVGPLLFVVGKLSVVLPGLFATLSGGLVVVKGFAASVVILSAKIIAIAAIIVGAIAVITAIGIAIKSAYDSFETFRKVVDFGAQKIGEYFKFIQRVFTEVWSALTEGFKMFSKWITETGKALGILGKDENAKKVAAQISTLNKEINKDAGATFAQNFERNFNGLVTAVTAGASKAKSAISNMIFTPESAPTALPGGGAAPVSPIAPGAAPNANGLVAAGNAAADVTKKMNEASLSAALFYGQLQQLNRIETVKENFTGLLNESLNPTDEALNRISATMTKVNETIAAAPLPKFNEQITAILMQLRDGEFTWDKFGLAISNVFAKLGQDVAQGGKDLAAFARSAVNSIRQVISALIAEGIAAVVSKTLISSGLTGPFAVAIAGAAGAAAAALFNTIIPAFANGGIVSGPTIGLMGEYPGARSNPEVIAPLSKLENMLGNRGSDNSDIVSAIQNNPPTVVTIDKNGFATNIQNGINRTQIINNRFSWKSK